jgi:hypothetical protein
MKVKVIENAYYVCEDLTGIGFVNESEFKSSFVHTLVIGDVWEKIKDEKGNFSDDVFKCIEGKMIGEESDGWWKFEGTESYFEVIED